jgi:ABC-2 type transport system ATP-binding protein
MATGTDLAVEVRGLTKRYGGLEALGGIDLEIRRGEIFGLLGPNGAGKTTTVEILEGYRDRDAGTVSVLGFDPATQRPEIQLRTGIVLQATGVEPYLSVRETLAMYATFYPRPRPVDEVLDLVGIGEKRDERVNRLSGGQQRRLNMAMALIGDPELLFLDEPTTGFDPSARHEAWAVVKDLASLGATVVLTTHYMDEVQFLADRVAVIVRGHIVAEGPPSALGLDHAVRTRIRYRPPSGVEVPDRLRGEAAPDGFVVIEDDEPVRRLHELTGWALEAGVDLADLEVSRPSLEEVYLQLTDGSPTTPASGSGTEAGA